MMPSLALMKESIDNGDVKKRVKFHYDDDNEFANLIRKSELLSLVEALQLSEEVVAAPISKQGYVFG